MLKLLITWILVSLSLLCHAAEYQYDLSVCAIFKNDAKWLLEWIDFHLTHGVEHFYLYDNGSEDHPEVALQQYLNNGVVEIIDWSYSHKTLTEWNTVQCNAYTDCIKKVRRATRWIAFIDTDEFLFCPDKSPLNIKLKKYQDCFGIAVNWVLYGTSNVEKIPDGSKLIDLLVMRAPLSHPTNLHVKCIVRPKYVSEIWPNPHEIVFKDRKKQKLVTENKIPTSGSTTRFHSVNVFRINHYWARDLDFFRNVKLKQRKWNLSQEKMIEDEQKLNAEHDPILKSDKA